MFVNLWRTAPFLRLLLPFAAGITAGMYFPVIPWLCMAVCALLWLVPSFLNLRHQFAWRRLRGAAVLGMMCCFGMALTVAADVRRDAGWFGHRVKEDMYCVAVLKEPPVRKRKSWKADVEVVMVMKEKWKPTKGAMLVYFREQPFLDYGSKILICATPQQITSSGNPGAFDYAQYCAKKNIYQQVFLDSSAWRQLPGNGGSRLGRWLNISRQYALNMLRKYIPSKEEYGVGQALLIGYRNELDQDIVQAYTNTGVVHIIAISGLHLGLIYVSLLQLLKWLPRKRLAETLKALLLIAVLWAFSLLTGASASVLRSAVMFTTIAVGQFVIGRHSNIFNTLAAAAFLLLCYNPYFLVDAGFQLSFLAVAGIVLCYRPLYDLWM
ncbi:MAG: ComEC/Rec2 family competence protein, partial [Chitinophaga sp.]